MAKPKKTINDELNDFFETWHCKEMVALIQSIAPIMELYDIEVGDNWVKEAVGEDNERNVILIRTAYLISRLADFHAGILCRIKVDHKDLWRKLEKEIEVDNGCEDQKDRNGITQDVGKLEEAGSCGQKA